MQKMTLPAGSGVGFLHFIFFQNWIFEKPKKVPKWGAMLSDSDFINAVRETIQPKLDQVNKEKTESEKQTSEVKK